MSRIGRDIAIALGIAFVIRRFVEPTKVVGDSMFPELHNGDRLLVDKAAYKYEGPKAGDVVVFMEPGTGRRLIKRVIGLPGDHIVIHNGILRVNDQIGSDDYTAEGVTSGEVDMEVPEGRYFCMGDNRLHSRDSRDMAIGCVPLSAIVGRVDIRVYPPGKVYNRKVISEDRGPDVQKPSVESGTEE